MNCDFRFSGCWDQYNARGVKICTGWPKKVSHYLMIKKSYSVV